MTNQNNSQTCPHCNSAIDKHAIQMGNKVLCSKCDKMVVASLTINSSVNTNTAPPIPPRPTTPSNPAVFAPRPPPVPSPPPTPVPPSTPPHPPISPVNSSQNPTLTPSPSRRRPVVITLLSIVGLLIGLLGLFFLFVDFFILERPEFENMNVRGKIFLICGLMSQLLLTFGSLGLLLLKKWGVNLTNCYSGSIWITMLILFKFIGFKLFTTAVVIPFLIHAPLALLFMHFINKTDEQDIFS